MEGERGWGKFLTNRAGDIDIKKIEKGKGAEFLVTSASKVTTVYKN